MKSIEDRADEYARSQCAGDCALCEDICRMTSVKSAFIAGARSEREEQADIELFEAGAAEYYAAYSNEDKAFARKHFKAGEQYIRKELTRWHDPKEELPEIGKDVLFRIKYPSTDIFSYQVGQLQDNGRVRLPLIGFGDIIGWREIHE